MRGQQYIWTEKLTKELNSKPISKIPLSELVKNDKYAHKIAEELKISRVQLRKVYMELKQILKDGKLDEEKKVNLYMLYPMLEYQKERRSGEEKKIWEKFVDLMYAFLDNIENYPDKKNLEIAEKFLTALVAYARKD